jgi:hypothetical protein
LWRCTDGLFFEVPLLASDALLTMLHPLLKNVLETVFCELHEDNGTGSFDLVITLKLLLKCFHHLKTAVCIIASSPYA